MATNAASNSSPYSRENVRRGIGHYLLGRSLSAMAGFVTIILLVRHMDTPSYAAYTAMLGLCVLFSMLAGFGMERALARFIPEGVMHHPVAQLANFLMFACVARLGLALFLIVALWLTWPALAPYFQGLPVAAGLPSALAVLLVTSTMFQLLSAIMQAMVLQKHLTRVMVVQWGGRLLLILALLASSDLVTLEQALWLMALPDGVGTVLLSWVIGNYLRRRTDASDPDTVACDGAAWPAWRAVARLAVNNYGYNLLAALPQGSTMILLAAAFLAAPFVAAYGFYINLLERFRQYLPLQFMLNLAEPVLIAGYVGSGDFQKLCRNSRLLYKFNLLLLLPALAWFAAISGELTGLLTGGRHAEHGWILPVLVLQLTIGSHATILQIVINAVGKSGILALSGCAALVAMGIAVIAVLVRGQLAWLLVTPLVYEIVNNLAALALLRRQKLRFDPQWRFHGKAILATMLAWFAATEIATLTTSSLTAVMLAGIAALVAFALTTLLVRPAEAGEFQALRELLKRRPVQREDT